MNKEPLICRNTGGGSARVNQAEGLLAGQRRELGAVVCLDDLYRWRDALIEQSRWRGGPLGVLGSMANDLAHGDEQTRLQVAACLLEWQGLLVRMVWRVRCQGELDSRADPDALATGLMAALQGGCLLARTSHNTDQLAHALDMALDRIGAFAVELP